MSFELRAPHTHLYPGLRLRLAPGEPLPRLARDLPGVVELSDGRAARATLERLGEDGAVLRVGAWTTAAGSSVVARRWQLEWWPAEDGSPGFRVRRRLPEDHC